MDTPITAAPAREQMVVGVRFMPVGKVYHFDATGYADLRKGDWVIVSTARGRQMGEIASFGLPRHGEADGPFKPIERLATNRDLAIRHYWSQKEIEAMVIAREKASTLSLPIKIVKAEYTFDGSRLSFQYSAEEEKPNLGSLLDDLQRSFKARVELRLIGPRDTAKIIGGGGACGLDTRCCSMFLTEFSPISIKMAKEQGISLNPTEITGMCGRLRCCLIYEYEQYVEARKQLPKRGKEVGTPHGPGKVVDLLPLKESALVLVGEVTHVVHRNDLQPLAELQALENKAASPCGLNPGCSCKHAKKRKGQQGASGHGHAGGEHDDAAH
ncbi:MAG TPA: regulatory iron-sulfur-containing complex subunit RicT [Anaerolineae bacterium]|nr:regulatory iron-sulfur-containing complex subunit RicT [Anaerolineae bacterium]